MMALSRLLMEKRRERGEREAAVERGRVVEAARVKEVLAAAARECAAAAAAADDPERMAQLFRDCLRQKLQASGLRAA